MLVELFCYSPQFFFTGVRESLAQVIVHNLLPVTGDMVHEKKEDIREQVEDAFGQQVKQPYEAVGKDITNELHLLAQLTDAFEFGQVQDPYLPSINGDHTFLCKG